MKKFNNNVFITIILVITLAFVFSLSTHSQQVVRRGKTFVAQIDSSRVRQEPIRTDYKYQKGDSIWSVYLSQKGKAFIVRYSKRTGRSYRQYLPQITEQLNRN